MIPVGMAMGYQTLLNYPELRSGGAGGNRTPDLDIANVALSQLSYGPFQAAAMLH